MTNDLERNNGRESFEQLEESCIFDCNDFFFYHKLKKESKKPTVSFVDAFKSPLSNNDSIHLHQYHDEPINSEILRSVAMNCGPNVTSLYFCSVKLTDRMVEAFLPHLHKIQHLQFESLHIGADSVRAIVKFCGKTLKSLRVHGCQSITSESCGWMVGAIGYNSPRLQRLKALDVSMTQVDDRGFSFLSKGFARLEYLDLGCCKQLTNDIQKNIHDGSFCHMTVLNMRGCKGIGDEGVVAL